ncbi:DUF3617 domain-containing protein [Pulveribacter suum]|uniref:DUF3617 domain-containing protein n=1 Tax=Pulveribacter suum TaxID=2116657 RepID=A0A2P1NJ84_9BURK|nr:DUF3617 family protein [Pulveribacter suum]AVP57139.1 hypothetical protein C7H73_05320 [Pulveribacter suum]
MRFNPLYLLALGAALWVAQTAAQGTQGKKNPMPARKSGLWEVTLRGESPGPRQGQTVLQCTNTEAEAYMLMSIVPGQENCGEVKVARRAKGAGYDIRTVCQTHSNRVDTRMELTGDLQTAYVGRFSAKYSQRPLRDPGPTVFEGRWLGDCKLGQRPGDMVLPNGVTVNVVDDKKRAEAHETEEHGHARR